MLPRTTWTLGRPPSPHPLLAPLLALLLVLIPGCPEDDDDDSTPGDDDSAGDDDSGDDDSGDDDSAGDDDSGDDDAENECAPGADWFEMLDFEDPQGDAGGYVVDIRNLHYQVDNGTLHMRMSSYGSFDDADPGVMIDLFVGDGETTYSLTYDNQVPNPDPLQLWTSSNDWLEPLPPPPSLCHGEGGASSLVLGVKLSEIGFEDAEELRGRAGVNLWDPSGSYTDMAPDGGTFQLFTVVEEPLIARASVVVDDTAGGDGDGVIDPGETLAVTIDLFNGGIDHTQSDVTGTLSLDPASTVTATVAQDTAVYHNAAVIPPMMSAHQDVAYEVTIDGGATEGQELRLTLDVAQASGPGWTLMIPVQFVGLALTEVHTDAQDTPAPFDVAGFSYGTTPDGRLVVQVTSHAPHGGDEPLWVFLDVDRSGEPDYALSTHDADGPNGGIYEWDPILGWDRFGTPDPFEYPVEGTYARLGAPLAALSNPVFVYGYVETLAPAGEILDWAPDDPYDLLNLPVLGFQDTPFLQLVSHTLTEISGDGDAYLDPSEQWGLSLQVRNDGTVDATSVSAEVQSGNADLTVVSGTVNFGAVAAGATAQGQLPATLSVEPTAPAYGLIPLLVAIDADGTPTTPSVTVPLGLTAGETTADAPLVATSGALLGDTSSYADDYDDPSPCTGYQAAGRDGVYAVDLTVGQQIVALLEYTQGGPDAVLYISSDATHPDSSCLEGADLGLGESETLTYTAVTDSTHYVVVDGYNWGYGHPYQLTLTF